MRPVRESMEDIAELAQRALMDERCAQAALIQILTMARLHAVRLRREAFEAMPVASEAIQ